jgi:cob(I)alamin adenosyltransferase
MNENGTASDNSAPLAENQYVKELFEILDNNGRDTSGLSALLGHVSEMENFVKRAEDKIADMKSQLSEMKDVQNHPVKTALQNAIKTLEIKVAEVKERLGELKHNIVEGCKNAVVAFKEKGISALDKLASFFHIKNGLKAMDKSVAQSVDICNKSILHIDNFTKEYYSAGRAVKNMARIMIGKEPIDAKKEAGKLARAVSAPYRAEKTILLNIQKVIGAAIAKIEQLESRAAERQPKRVVEKKPSMLAELAENLERVEREKLERAVPESVKTKGAEL